VIHAGRNVGVAPGGFRTVPKMDLASAVQRLLGEGRLNLHNRLERRMAETLLKEMQNFKVKASLKTGQETVEAWREGLHDDCVLAAAMCAWLGEHGLLRPGIFC
jgi:hypothetical protein